MRKWIALLITAALVLCGTALAEETFSFADLKDVTFEFSSGVGAWSTELTVDEDGTFVGLFHDSEAGDADEASYPNGTIYTCAFSGVFEIDGTAEDGAIVLKVASLTVDDAEEEIADGIRYAVADMPYGFENAESFKLYLPGANSGLLTEELLMWSHPELNEDGTMPYFTLVDETNGNCFTGVTVTED